MKYRIQSLAATLFLIAALLYLPTLDDPPLNWDDPEYVELPVLQQPDALLQIWTSFATPQVYPVLFTSLWLDQALWGGSIPATRATNLILHGLSSVLAFLFIRTILRGGAAPSVGSPRDSGFDSVAFLGALLFALHPTQVATVAWIAERKNLLAAIFVLLSLLAYRRAVRLTTAGRTNVLAWLPTYLFGLLAMLSKSSAVVLPLLILWMELWVPVATTQRGSVAVRRKGMDADPGPKKEQDQRVLPHHRPQGWKPTLLRTVPFFLLAIAQSGLTMFREHGPAITTDTSWIDRIAISARAIWFYLGKLIWPSDLSPMYSRWSLDSSMLLLGTIALAGLCMATFLLFRVVRRAFREPVPAKTEGFSRVPLASVSDNMITTAIFGLGFFGIANLPTIGLIPFGYMEKSFVADHFLYLPAVGFWITVSALLQFAVSRLEGSGKRSAAVAMVAGVAAVALGFGALSAQRLPHWRDSEAFWSRAIETSPTAWVAWGNRGEFRARGGRWSDARSDLEAALQIRPEYPEAHFNLGYVMDRQGDLDGARAQYERAVSLSPNFAEAHLNLGIVLARQGDLAGTRREIEAARSLNRDIPVPPSIDSWLRERAP